MIATLLLVGLLAGATVPGGNWISLLSEAEDLRKRQRYAEAETRYTAALREAKRIDPEGLAVAVVQNNSGYLYQQRGQLREAIQKYAHALSIFQRQIGRLGDHDVVESAMNLSGAYLEAGEVKRSESLLRRFLEKDVELEPPTRAAILTDLGSVLVEQGNLKPGERMFREALEIFERQTRGPKERMVVILSNLAGVCVRTNRLAEGLEYSRRARAILLTISNPSPNLVIKTHMNAAVIYAVAGRPKEAEELYRSTITLCEATFGSDHYLLGPLLQTYAQFLSLMNRKGEAKRIEKRAQAINSRFNRENAIGFTVNATSLSGPARSRADDIRKDVVISTKP